MSFVKLFLQPEFALCSCSLHPYREHRIASCAGFRYDLVENADAACAQIPLREIRMMRFAFLAAVFVWLLATPLPAQEKLEPRYKGKPIAYWVDKLRKADTDQLQADAAFAIASFGADGGAAVPLLVEMLDDRSQEFRWMAYRTLCALGDATKPALPALAKSLKAGKVRDPEIVIPLLAMADPEMEDIVPALIVAIQDPHHCQAAIQALRSIGPFPKAAFPAIRQAILAARKQEDEVVFACRELVVALSGLGDAAVPLLIELLEGNDAGLSHSSARSLGEFGPAAKQASPKLLILLQHKDPEVKLAAAHSLWRIEKNGAIVSVLAGLLKDRDRSHAASAADLLGEMGPLAKEALPALLEAANKEPYPSYETIRQVAAKAAIQKIEGGATRK
jgi:HEAT repeat protein